MNVPRETFPRVEVKTCPVCGSPERKPFLTTTDFSCSKESFDIVQCSVCGFKYTSPIPAEEHIGSYYKFADYISHTNRSGGLFGFVYRRVRAIALKRKLRLLAKHARGKNLLDIGCGTGFFAAAAQQSGYTVTGLEPDTDARKYAIEQNKVNALPADELARLKGPYDVITLWHVLEHVYHLKRDAGAISSLLGPTGILVVAVPNCASLDAKEFGTHWAGYDVPRHLYHFVQQDLVNLFKPHGLQLTEVAPMQFDAYYVSMLSRQHSGKGKLGGVFAGLRSNQSARAKRTPWSSQIYVFTR